MRPSLGTRPADWKPKLTDRQQTEALRRLTTGESARERAAASAGRRTTVAESKSQLFARLMDEELSRLEKAPEEPITRSEFLDALRAVHDKAPTEIQEDIYTLAKALVEALGAGTDA
jgi:hypothetical protein